MAYTTLMGDFNFIQVMKYTPQPGSQYTVHNIPTIKGVTRYGLLLIGGGAGGSNKNGSLDNGTNGVVSSSGSCFYDIINTGDATSFVFRVGRGGAGAPNGGLDLIPGEKGIQTTVSFGSSVIHASGGGNIHPPALITDSRFGYKQDLYGTTDTSHNVTVIGPGGAEYTYYGNRSLTNPTTKTIGAPGLLYGQGGQGPGPWTFWTSDTRGGNGGDGLAILFWNAPVEGAVSSNVYYNEAGIVYNGTELYFNDNNVIRKATEMWYNNNGNIVQVYGAKKGLQNNEFLIERYTIGFTNLIGFENTLYGDSGTAEMQEVLYHHVEERAGKYKAMFALQSFKQIPNTKLNFIYTASDNTWKQFTYTWVNGHYESTITSADYQWFNAHINQVIRVRYTA